MRHTRHRERWNTHLDVMTAREDADAARRGADFSKTQTQMLHLELIGIFVMDSIELHEREKHMMQVFQRTFTGRFLVES